MIRVVASGIAGFGLIACVLFAPASPAVQGAHAADGYNQIIRHIFAERGWLWLQPAEGDGEALPHVGLAPDIADIPVIRRFLASSYLQEDLASSDPGVWQISGDNVRGVSPHRHAIPGPFEGNRVWRGDIEYRQTVDSGLWLVDAERRFELPLQDDPESGSSVLNVFRGASDVVPSAAGSYHLVADDGTTIGRIFQIGDRTLISVTQDTAVMVTVDGLEANPRLGRVAYQALSPGSSIRFARDGMQPQILRVEGDQNTISRYSPFLGRRRDPSFRYLAEPIEQAMFLPGNNNTEDRELPFVTTLDRDVQAAAQTQLTDIGGTQEDEGEIRAAATVMDTMTGEVLALASFPRTVDDLPPALRATHSGRRLMEADHNLATLAVGSSIKPVFAAAIVSADDRFRSFRLGRGTLNRAGRECAFERLLWVDVERPAGRDDLAGVNDEYCRDVEIGFTDFLVESSNRYAMALMLLAAQRDLRQPRPLVPLAGSDAYYLNGSWHTEGLEVLFAARGRTETGVLLRGSPRRLGLSWTRALNEAFGVKLDDVDPDPGQPLEDRLQDLHQVDFWGEQLADDSSAVVALSGISPQREMLDLGSVDHVTNDYLQLILGGGASRWTTIKMAEMFSQLVTGQRVHAVLNHGDPYPASRSVLTNSALAAVQEGLRVTAGRGTAGSLAQLEADLQDVAGEGVEVRLYAKTGTPTIEHPVRSPVNAAVNRMIGQGLLSSDRPDRWRIGRRPSRDIAERDALIQTLGSDPRIQSLLRSEGVSSEAAATYILDLRAGSPRYGNLLRRGLRGALMGVHADEEPLFHDGSVVGVVVALYREGRATPEAGLTIFVNFQARWSARRTTPNGREPCGYPNLCYIRALGETEAFRRAVQTRAEALRAGR